MYPCVQDAEVYSKPAENVSARPLRGITCAIHSTCAKALSAMDDPSNARQSWTQAVTEAIYRYSLRHGTQHIERQRLIAEELPVIIEAVGSRGKTPHQTLSRELQQLRGSLLAFLGNGHYQLLNESIDITDAALALPQKGIADALIANKLRFPDVETGDHLALQKRRRGQSVLRRLTLLNYHSRCALCDIEQSQFLVASHIASWKDWPDDRGNLCNVLCLCRFHDALFDKGHISLSDNYDLLVNDTLKPSQMFDQVLQATVSFNQPERFAPCAQFLMRHRAHWQFN
jgi:predicted restriction endonuclease